MQQQTTSHDRQVGQRTRPQHLERAEDRRSSRAGSKATGGCPHLSSGGSPPSCPSAGPGTRCSKGQEHEDRPYGHVQAAVAAVKHVFGSHTQGFRRNKVWSRRRPDRVRRARCCPTGSRLTLLCDLPGQPSGHSHALTGLHGRPQSPLLTEGKLSCLRATGRVAVRHPSPAAVRRCKREGEPA